MSASDPMASPLSKGSVLAASQGEARSRYFRFETRGGLTWGAHNQPSFCLLEEFLQVQCLRAREGGCRQQHWSVWFLPLQSGWGAPLVPESQGGKICTSPTSYRACRERAESCLLLPWRVHFESVLLLLLGNPIKIQYLAKLAIFIPKA